MRRLVALRASVVVASLVYGSLLVFLRTTPTTGNDEGIFLSVIGRLLAGDRLYADVFDNKDPLFFYSGAVAVSVAGWKGLPALDALWLGIAALSTAGLLRAIGASRLLACLGFVAYPLLLTAAWYYAGFSMLAALALVPLVGWLWARERWLAAGAVVGVALGFKLSLALVLVAVPVSLAAVGGRAGRSRTALMRAGSGLVASIAALAVVLGVRGELDPYLSMQLGNVTYSEHVLPYMGRSGGIRGHLQVVLDDTQHTPRVFALFVAGCALALWTLWRDRRDPGSRNRLLAAIVLGSSAATLVTLALTAAWVHHLQMLAYPETLLALFLASVASGALWRPRARPVVTVVLSAVALWGLGAFDASVAPSSPRSLWWSGITHPSAEALEAAADRRFSGARTITYARFGRDDEDGHALFLDSRFDLVCPRFHQHLHTEDLDAVVRCVEQQRPQLVLVGSGFGYDPTATPRWNAFAEKSEVLLARDYEQTFRQPLAEGVIEVWARRRA